MTMFMWTKPSVPLNHCSESILEYKCNLRIVKKSLNQCMERIEFVLIPKMEN